MWFTGVVNVLGDTAKCIQIHIPVHSTCVQLEDITTYIFPHLGLSGSQLHLLAALMRQWTAARSRLGHRLEAAVAALNSLDQDVPTILRIEYLVSAAAEPPPAAPLAAPPGPIARGSRGRPPPGAPALQVAADNAWAWSSAGVDHAWQPACGPVPRHGATAAAPASADDAEWNALVAEAAAAPGAHGRAAAAPGWHSGGAQAQWAELEWGSGCAACRLGAPCALCCAAVAAACSGIGAGGAMQRASRRLRAVQTQDAALIADAVGILALPGRVLTPEQQRLAYLLPGNPGVPGCMGRGGVPAVDWLRLAHLAACEIRCRELLGSFTHDTTSPL